MRWRGNECSYDMNSPRALVHPRVNAEVTAFA